MTPSPPPPDRRRRERRSGVATLVLTATQWDTLRDAIVEAIACAEQRSDARSARRWASLLGEIDTVREDL